MSLYSFFLPFFLGDELFSDTYKMKLVDDCLWEVYGKVMQCKKHSIKATERQLG